MDLQNFLTEKGIEIVLDMVIEKVKKGVLAELAPQFQSIDSRLERIEGKIDAQRAAPVKAGLSFLSLNEVENAKAKFVDAEVQDPHAAVAKLWLGILLSITGHRQIGREKILEAVAMNPFVLPQPMLGVEVFQKASLRQFPDFKWMQSLNDGDLINRVKKLIPENLLDTWLTAYLNGERLSEKVGALRTISCSAQGTVIAWQLSENFAKDDKPKYAFISAFDLVEGKNLWTKSFPERDLYFASDQYVVLIERGQAKYFELLDFLDGRILSRVNEDYFVATFCPHSDLRVIEAFSKSNKTFTGYAVYLNKAEQKMSELRKKQNIFAKFFGFPPSYKESNHDENTVTHPLFPELFSVRSVNNWTYDSEGRTYRVGNRMLYGSTLNCDASLVVQPAKRTLAS